MPTSSSKPAFPTHPGTSARPRQALRKPTSVGFLLLDNFSLTCFAQSLDVLVTANLVEPGAVKTYTFSQHDGVVVSDLGIPVKTDTPLTEVRLHGLDLLVVCGGLRAPRLALPWLTKLLHTLAHLPIALGGLWNGAWYLAKAGLLDGYRCAIHSEQRAALAESAPKALVSMDSVVLDRDRLTASTPAGAFQFMIRWLQAALDNQVADAVYNLLANDQCRQFSAANGRGLKLSPPLQTIVDMMKANLEEPLGMDHMAACVSLSRRQIERAFREQIGKPPQRYYFELRLTEAKRLIKHSNLPIIGVAIACGFVSTLHFSRSYKGFFGVSPSREQRYET